MNCGNTDLRKSYPKFPRDSPVAYTCPKCGCQWQSPPDNWTKNWQEDTKEAKENEE